MAFGKRSRVDDVPLSSSDEGDDVIMYENHDTSSDDDQANEHNQGSNNASQSTQTTNFDHVQPKEKRVDCKPLLDEVIMKGAAKGKNPGGAKKWQCKYCNVEYTSTYSRIHAHFFGVAVGKKK